MDVRLYHNSALVNPTFHLTTDKTDVLEGPAQETTGKTAVADRLHTTHRKLQHFR